MLCVRNDSELRVSGNSCSVILGPEEMDSELYSCRYTVLLI